jgi:DNA-binding transcriptional regulator YiaG
MAEKGYTTINCIRCNKPMNIRNDYVKKHSGVCMCCQKKGNKQAYKDGRTKTRLYHIWIGLKFRRYKKYNPKILFTSWEHFKEWALNNGYQDNLTIDRINNKGDYSPKNCQWITLEENAGKDKIIFSNNEKIKIFLERKQLGLTQREMAKKLNVSRNTIQRAEKYAKGVI